MDVLLDLAKTLLHELGDALAPVIAVAAVGALVQLFRKWGFDISAAKRQTLQDAAERAVRRTEEEAAAALQRALKTGLPAVEMTAPQKFAQAVAYTRADVPNANPEDVVANVTAALPATGFGAAAKAAANPATK